MKPNELINAVDDSVEFKSAETLTSQEYKEKIEKTFQLESPFKNIFKEYIFKTIPWIIGVTSIILYILTLKGCKGTQFECVTMLTSQVVRTILYLLMSSAFLITLQISLVIYNKNFIHSFLATILSFTFICFIYDTGADFDSHGAYNRLILFFCVILWAIIFFLGRIIFSSIRKFPIFTIVLLIVISYSINSLGKNIINKSCIGWEQGLKGVEIDNNSLETKCKIRPPKICYFQIFNGYMDVTKFLGETCDKMNTNKLSNNIDHIVDKSAKVLGYPRTEKWGFFPESQDGKYTKNVMKNIINMEDPKISQQIKDKIEVITNFKYNPPKVTIDLKRDEKLVNSRKILWQKNKKFVLNSNVLHIFIDSVSRPNFKRKMPRLHKWLESKYVLPGEKLNSQAKTEVFQFMKFHGIGQFTGINMVPSVFGVYNIYFNGEHFITDYKSRGFITGQATNYCGREIFAMDPGAITHLKWDNFDHELASFFCDGNFTPYDDMYAILVGVNSIRLRCMYNKSLASYNIEYANQFFSKYKNEAKYFRMMFYDAHEGTQEVIKYTDPEITDFLIDFEKKGYLEDTIVIIQTDHGLGMAGVYSGLDLEDYHKETVLPSLFMVMPTDLPYYSEIRDNLKHNEQAMATHFTVFNTLHAITGGAQKYSNFEEYDLMFDKIPKTRNCDYLKSHDYWNWYTLHCRCEKD
jgi:hypothetical protein